MAFLDFLPFVGDVVKGVTGVISQNNTNKTNLQIAREQNKVNQDIAKQNNEAMLQATRTQTDASFAMQRENQQFNANYNSAPQQVARARSAGLNPAMTVDGAGSVSTGAGSAPSAPSLQMPSQTTPSIQNPWSNFGFGLGEASEAIKNIELAKGQGIENDYKVQQMINELNRQIAEISMLNISGKEKEEMISYMKQQRAEILQRLTFAQEDRDRSIESQQKQLRAQDDFHDQMQQNIAFGKEINPKRIATEVARAQEAQSNARAAAASASYYLEMANNAKTEGQLKQIEYQFQSDPEIIALRKKLYSSDEQERAAAAKQAENLAKYYEEAGNSWLAEKSRKWFGLTPSEAASAAGNVAFAYGVARGVKSPKGKATAGTVGRSETTVLPKVIGTADRNSRALRTARINTKAAAAKAKARIDAAKNHRTHNMSNPYRSHSSSTTY